ncbi:MAG: DUF2478 domain-containing protein [Rhodobacteraceae bacterium]|nr:DUF2478 domain-containing protein [Paracoccaceae bacterium]
MLGYVISQGQGAADRLLAGVAFGLLAEGRPIAGAVQRNVLRDSGAGDGLPAQMELDVLASGARIRISQDLGALAAGCRLDPGALEAAVGLVEAALAGDPPPVLLVVNKFGRQEAEGRGFRATIGAALAAGIPVLTSVSADRRAAFEAFAGGLAEPLAPEPAAIRAWCLRQIG